MFVNKQTPFLQQLLICVDVDVPEDNVDVTEDNVDEDNVDVTEDNVAEDNVDEDNNDDEQPRRVIPVTPGSGHFA